ncbi:MAG TPA: hypothetical protein VMU16_13605 [Candidatus Binataceae bacterium]|nr:hypothetical protein [Candidatus Binataceae bacterium]
MGGQGESRAMRLVDELADAAARMGLTVRRERILREIGYRVRGGSCRLREKNLVIVDPELPASEQVEVLATALRILHGDGLESIFLSPAARRAIGSPAAAAQAPAAE